jgi:type I restriction enzyme S subunit
MSYPVYPMVKPSGVEWLGELPLRWQPMRLKYLLRKKITDGPHATPTFVDTGVPFLSVDGIQDGELVFEGCRFVSEEDHAAYRVKALPESGDILLGKAASTGKVARVKVGFEFSIWSPLALIKPNEKKINPTFLEYAFKCIASQAQIDVLCTSNTQKNISMDDIPTVVFALPPVTEQQQIASFLDRKTAELDAVIRLKERQLELLAEKRQALISQAVTRGLDPNVPLKPSGIPWLGDVPEHWAIIPVWMLFNLGRGRVISNLEILDNPGSYPVYSSQTENNGVMGYLDTYDFEGTYLTWTTDGAKAGTVFYREGKFNCTNVCGTLKAKRIGIEPKYFQFALSLATPGYVRYDINPKLMNDEMAHILIPKPSLEEQQSIVAYLDTETARMEGVGAAIKTQIETLREYRQALVSAAVTGKIDVRGEP